MSLKHHMHRFKAWFWRAQRTRPTAPDQTLAVPEVHTGKVTHTDPAETPGSGSILYDNVAVPEVHPTHHK